MWNTVYLLYRLLIAEQVPSIILLLLTLAISLATLAVVATFLIRLAEVLAVSSDNRANSAYVRQTFVET